MSLPVIAITNASTCLTDLQVLTAIPLQRQVTLDVRAYWDVDCQLVFLDKEQALPDGWWQISVTDNHDQAGALGYHELTSRGTPLGVRREQTEKSMLWKSATRSNPTN